MGYIFDDWKKLLDNFQSSVEKDLEEIHQQKSEVQQIKADLIQRFEKGHYYRDDDTVIISAPNIVIGNVDKNGDLLSGGIGNVIIKGSGVALEGVGDGGSVVTRASSIRQTAVDPGVDGVENVVRSTSEIVSQAGSIVLHSSEAKDAFSMSAVPPLNGGITIHADQTLNLEAALSAEGRKEQIEATVEGLSKQAEDLNKQIEKQKKSVDDCFKKMSDLLDKENKHNKEDSFLNRVDLKEISLTQEGIDDLTPVLYQATLQYIHLVSQLAEVKRQKKALEAEKGKIKTGDDFKKKSTGARMNIVAERIDVATADGDGYLHTQPGAGISVRTPNVNMSMMDAEGKLVEHGGFSVNAQNISLSSVNPKEK